MAEEAEEEVIDQVAAVEVIDSECESELDEPRWAVVSFDKSEAASLTYEEASDLMAELDSKGVAGLCIVTNDAARRIKG